MCVHIYIDINKHIYVYTYICKHTLYVLKRPAKALDTQIQAFFTGNEHNIKVWYECARPRDCLHHYLCVCARARARISQFESLWVRERAGLEKEGKTGRDREIQIDSVGGGGC